jgi:hypothetical protein
VDEVGRQPVVVAAEWAIDAAEPVEAVSVAGPHERAVGHIGEPGDSTSQAIVAIRLTEADQAQRQRAVDGRLKVDVVAAGSHRCAVDIGHERYSALEMETFKRYLFFQAMMFVFGIVGPIFLIMFFASQPDPALRWAYWWGLCITTGDILIALWLAGANTDAKGPKDARIAVDVARRTQGGRGRASDQSSSSASSTFDPFTSTSLTFSSNDTSSSDFSSSSDYSSSDYSSNDSGSSSSDSGSSSSD